MERKSFDRATKLLSSLPFKITTLAKAVWLDAFETFDLEAEELQQAVRKWERRNKKAEAKKQPKAEAAASARFASVKDMSVEGIEHGIVLATA